MNSLNEATNYRAEISRRYQRLSGRMEKQAEACYIAVAFLSCYVLVTLLLVGKMAIQVIQAVNYGGAEFAAPGYSPFDMNEAAAIVILLASGGYMLTYGFKSVLKYLKIRDEWLVFISRHAQILEEIETG